MGKTKKQPYRKSRAFDSSCRCHGGCPWCEGNRKHGTDKRSLTADEQLTEGAGSLTIEHDDGLSEDHD